MKNKEVIFISNYLGNGGAARVIVILAQKLIKQNKNVTIVTFNGKGYEYDLHEKINKISIEVTGKNKIVSKFDRIKSVRKIMKDKPGATIISFEYFVNMQTIVASIGLKNKIIISERNDPAQENKRFIIKHLRNILYRWADVLVCQTSDAKAYFPKKVQDKSIIIPNPIKEDLPLPYTGIRNKEIITFSRLEKQKNFPLLIEAFEMLHKNHPQYKLVIYGDGSQKEIIEQLIMEKHLNEYIQIFPPTLDIHQKALKCEMFVMASDYEGLSNSMLEAMAIGLPVVVTDCPCGGARMMIKHGDNGLLVPVGNKKRLYESMKNIIEDKELSNSLSRNAVKIREQLSTDEIVMCWNALI